MKRITRNIDPAAARDLLQRAPRACLAYASAEGPQAQPVRLNWRNDQYRIALPPAASHPPLAGQEVVLLVDEGIYYFDLRAIYVRGIVNPIPPPAGDPPSPAWFELIPAKVVAWDYGAMREAEDER